MVCLARKVGGGVHVSLGGLEFRISQIAPKDRRHPKLVGISKCFGHLRDLPRRFFRAEIDGGTYRDGSHRACLFDSSEHHLVEFVWVRQQLVVVDLYDKRYLVSVFSCDRTKNSKGRSNRVTSALDRQLNDIFRVEI